ncbi:MAG: hypothetical protein KC766_17795 [Myxococcales bacterium]|nr:hypothetical protein [Myxococcales bacterium]
MMAGRRKSRLGDVFGYRTATHGLLARDGPRDRRRDNCAFRRASASKHQQL